MRFWDTRRIALGRLKHHWQRFGREDPFWAVLTGEEKKDGGWNTDEFFETGEIDVANLLERAARFGIDVQYTRALDFGCGPGRLTQALAGRFETVDGVDIAQSMVDLAQPSTATGPAAATK